MFMCVIFVCFLGRGGDTFLFFLVYLSLAGMLYTIIPCIYIVHTCTSIILCWKLLSNRSVCVCLVVHS